MWLQNICFCLYLLLGYSSSSSWEVHSKRKTKLSEQFCNIFHCLNYFQVILFTRSFKNQYYFNFPPSQPTQLPTACTFFSLSSIKLIWFRGIFLFLSYFLFQFLTFQDFFHFCKVLAEEREKLKMGLIAILALLKLILKLEKVFRCSEKLEK